MPVVDWEAPWALELLEDIGRRLGGVPAHDLAALARRLEHAHSRMQVRIPARLLRDLSAGGGLECALRCCVERQVADRDVMAAVSKALEAVRLLQWPRIAWDDSVPAVTRLELSEIARMHNAQIVGTNDDPTHYVCWDAGVDGAPSAQPAPRTLAVNGARALVHYSYLPDSRDEWVDADKAPPPLEDQEPLAWTKPLNPRHEPWQVCCRFVRDVGTHHEWGNEYDYELEDEARSRKRKRVEGGALAGRPTNERSVVDVASLPPSRDDEPTTSIRARRDVVVATIDLAESKPIIVQNNGEVTRLPPSNSDLTVSTAVVPKLPMPKMSIKMPTDTSSSSSAAPAAAAASHQLRRNVFDANGVTPLERACCPEWFCGDSAKSPDHYIEARNWMITQSNSRPQILLTATFCRQRLGLDACATIRLFNFVDAWGLVNSQVPAASRRLPKPRPRPPPFFNKERDDSKHWTPHELRALVTAARHARDDWPAIARAVNAVNGSKFDPADCAARFVDLPLRDPLGGLPDSAAPTNGAAVPAADAAPVAPAPSLDLDSGRDALDALIEVRSCNILDSFAPAVSTRTPRTATSRAHACRGRTRY